jgi:hypothetical protein
VCCDEARASLQRLVALGWVRWSVVAPTHQPQSTSTGGALAGHSVTGELRAAVRRLDKKNNSCLLGLVCRRKARLANRVRQAGCLLSLVCRREARLANRVWQADGSGASLGVCDEARASLLRLAAPGWVR